MNKICRINDDRTWHLLVEIHLNSIRHVDFLVFIGNEQLFRTYFLILTKSFVEIWELWTSAFCQRRFQRSLTVFFYINIWSDRITLKLVRIDTLKSSRRRRQTVNQRNLSRWKKKNRWKNELLILLLFSSSTSTSTSFSFFFLRSSSVFFFLLFFSVSSFQIDLWFKTRTREEKKEKKL